MKKDCCNIKVTEIKNGFRFEITGEDVKNCCKNVMPIMSRCCEDSKTADVKKSSK